MVNCHIALVRFTSGKASFYVLRFFEYVRPSGSNLAVLAILDGLEP